MNFIEICCIGEDYSLTIQIMQQFLQDLKEQGNVEPLHMIFSSDKGTKQE